MNMFLSDFSLYIRELLDIFYKLALIIAAFYATKAFRIYIYKNSTNKRS
jgi:hypothetical protein